jgi:predicted transcriptional regulator
MFEMYYIYIFSFLLGFIGSVAYFLFLFFYEEMGRFKTTEGRIKIFKIFGLCTIGGIFAVSLQATIKDGFAPVHSALLGAIWMVVYGPSRNVLYQLHEERKNYKKLLSQKLIYPASRKISSLKVKDFIKKDIKKVSPATSLFLFLPAIRDNESHLVIVEENKSPCKVIGVIGKRDIIEFLLANKLNKDLKSIQAHEVMNKDFVYAQSDETFNQVITKMDKADIINIVVLNKDKELLGWVNEKAFRSGVINKLYSK